MYKNDIWKVYKVYYVKAYPKHIFVSKSILSHNLSKHKHSLKALKQSNNNKANITLKYIFISFTSLKHIFLISLYSYFR